jgi:AAA+ superfamily predicted ATPase
LARRFDMAIEYEMPDREQALEVLRRRLDKLGAPVQDWSAVAEAAIGLSQAEICLAAGQVVKKAILKATPLDEKHLVRHLQARHTVRKRFAS